MRVYHFANARYGLEDIKNRRLKVALIDQLNDPFEFLGVASRDREIRRRYQLLKAGLAKYMGLLCFSANWHNPVQWSHYAEHHHGICMGFDVLAGLHPVRYSDERLKSNAKALEAGGETAEAHMRTILTTKFRHWEYEEEQRLFVKLQKRDDTGHYFFGFGEGLRLREVIVGPLASLKKVDVSEAIGNLKAVRLSKARLAFKSFAIVKQRQESLWR